MKTVSGGWSGNLLKYYTLGSSGGIIDKRRVGWRQKPKNFGRFPLSHHDFASACGKLGGVAIDKGLSCKNFKFHF